MNVEKLAGYGFSAYKDKNEARDAIWLKEQNPGAFGPELYLASIGKTDDDYSGVKINNDQLALLDKKWDINEYIKSHPGYIEERPGYTKKKDVYMTPEGAKGVASYILGKSKATDDDMASAVKKELDIQQSIDALKARHIERQESLAEKVRDKLTNYEVSKNMTLPGRVVGIKDFIQGKVMSGAKSLDESIYRHKLDNKLHNMEKAPLDVTGRRFAEAIDAAVDDNNELFSFRYY